MTIIKQYQSLLKKVVFFLLLISCCQISYAREVIISYLDGVFNIKLKTETSRAYLSPNVEQIANITHDDIVDTINSLLGKISFLKKLTLKTMTFRISFSGNLSNDETNCILRAIQTVSSKNVKIKIIAIFQNYTTASASASTVQAVPVPTSTVGSLKRPTHERKVTMIDGEVTADVTSEYDNNEIIDGDLIDNTEEDDEFTSQAKELFEYMPHQISTSISSSQYQSMVEQPVTARLPTSEPMQEHSQQLSSTSITLEHQAQGSVNSTIKPRANTLATSLRPTAPPRSLPPIPTASTIDTPHNRTRAYTVASSQTASALNAAHQPLVPTQPLPSNSQQSRPPRPLRPEQAALVHQSPATATQPLPSNSQQSRPPCPPRPPRPEQAALVHQSPVTTTQPLFSNELPTSIVAENNNLTTVNMLPLNIRTEANNPIPVPNAIPIAVAIRQTGL